MKNLSVEDLKKQSEKIINYKLDKCDKANDQISSNIINTVTEEVFLKIRRQIYFMVTSHILRHLWIKLYEKIDIK
jgi:hypothetical protein